jgi:acetoin utilization protein AcuB
MSKLNIMRVEEYTSPNLITVDFKEDLTKVSNLMHTNQVRHIPITENGRVVGIISKRDLQPIKKEAYSSLKAKDLMIPDPYTVSNMDLIHEVAFQMSDRKIGSAIVTQDGKVYGIFTTTDALNALVEIVRESL